MNRKKVGYVTLQNHLDVRSWSGTINNLYRNISERYEVYPIYLHSRFFRGIEIIKKIIYKLLGKTLIYKSRCKSKYYGKKIRDVVIKNKLDVLVCVASSDAMPYINFDIPIIYITDATFGSMIGYYYSNLTSRNTRLGNEIEKGALDQSSKILMCSNWAYEYANQNYSISKDKLEVSPLYAFIEDNYQPRSYEIKSKDYINLLLIGVEWKRKGVDIAIDALNILNNDKVKYKLTIIGLEKPEGFHNDNVEFMGFVNKSTPEGQNTLINKLLTSDVFVLPTQAECAGIVFSEASMYGLPIVTFDTGGTTTYVKNEVNGYALNKKSTPIDFANKIEHICSSNETYIDYSIKCRNFYENELSREVWTKKFDRVIDELTTKKESYGK